MRFTGTKIRKLVRINKFAYKELIIIKIYCVFIVCKINIFFCCNIFSCKALYKYIYYVWSFPNL